MDSNLPSYFRESARVGEQEIFLETGRLARQAEAAVWIRQGETVVQVTVVAADEDREEADFFPLTVEYRERFSAAGRFPGGYRKREGRISDGEILSSRLIDRTIRPLFPEGFHQETQVQATVLAYEPGTDPEALAITGAAAALHLSSLPFDGPVAGVRVVRTAGGLWTAFPNAEQRTKVSCDLVISIGPMGLVMLEGEAAEITETDLLAALELAAEAAAPLHALCERAREEAGKPKRGFAVRELDDSLIKLLRGLAEEPIRQALKIEQKKERAAALEAVRGEALSRMRDLLPGTADGLEADAGWFIGNLEAEILRRRVLDEGMRADGRGPADIRPIRSEVDVLPRVHGSALFTRGETQALVVATLGTGMDEQEVESLAGKVRERFQLFYNFPPYAVGEIRPLRGPGRREIGHGNLARRALSAVLPAAEGFPYTIKLESEILESNGSSSMATVCGGCLAMMDAGVPILRPVAGIAMGLIQEEDRAVVLSDILGVEDHLGDMDFKVAGTTVGITAVQLDNKVGSLAFDLLEKALEQARVGRLHILQRMEEALARPRADLSPRAPRIEIMKIRPNRIRDLIGPGGRHIQDLQSETGTKVDVTDDGTVRIYALEAGALPQARRRVRDLTGEPEVGKLYRGTVTGVKEFGCFVRLFQGIEGLVHVSELAEGHVRDVASVATEGDSMVVKVVGVDGGRIQLSRKAALGAREGEIENA